MNLGQTIGELRLRIMQLEDENEALRRRGGPMPTPLAKSAPLYQAVDEPRLTSRARIGTMEQLVLRTMAGLPRESSPLAICAAAARLTQPGPSKEHVYSCLLALTRKEKVVRSGTWGEYRYSLVAG